MRRQPPPEAENAVRRGEDDDKENEANQRVEAIGADHVDGESLQDDIDRRADERPDRMAQAADHRDDQNADDLADADGAGRNAAVEPDIEHAGRARR